MAQREELDGILESFEVEEHSRQQQLQKSENYLQQLSQPKMRNEKSAKFFGGVESAHSDEEKRRMQVFIVLWSFCFERKLNRVNG